MKHYHVRVWESQHQRDKDLYYIRDMNTLAERLFWARGRKQLSQEQLAALAGVSQSTIGNLEAGIRLSARKLPQIASVLGVDALWLADGKGKPFQAGAEQPGLSLANPPPNLLPSHEQIGEMVMLFMKMPPEYRETLLESARGVVEMTEQQMKQDAI